MSTDVDKLEVPRRLFGIENILEMFALAAACLKAATCLDLFKLDNIPGAENDIHSASTPSPAINSDWAFDFLNASEWLNDGHEITPLHDLWHDNGYKTMGDTPHFYAEHWLM